MRLNKITQFDSNKLRNLCIRENWYTCGTNKQYDNLLRFVDGNMYNDEVLTIIVLDIYNHSDTSMDEEYGYKAIIQDIAQKVLNECTFTFIDVIY